MHLGLARRILGDKKCPYPRVGWEGEEEAAATTACSACQVPKLVPVGAGISWHGHIVGECPHWGDFSRVPEHLSTSVLQHFLCPQRGLSPGPGPVPCHRLCCGPTCPAHVVAAGCHCCGTGIRRDAWGSTQRVGGGARCV